MKAMHSFVRLGANRSHSLFYGEDLQQRMADEGAVSCIEIYESQHQVLTHEARGVPLDGHLTRPVPFADRAIDADVKSLLHHEPQLDGIFASSDLLAIAAIGELHRHGKRVPDDVAVVGYDDIAMARYCQHR